MLDRTNYHMIPTYTLNALDRYAMHGGHLGHFLAAVVSNNLKESIARADDNNGCVLREIVMYMHNEMPANSHGSVALYKAWVDDTDEIRTRVTGLVHDRLAAEGRLENVLERIGR